MNKRPSDRLHWVTWVVLLIVGAAILCCQVDGGWPFVAMTMLAQVLNVCLSLTLTGSTVFLIESRSRRPKPLQIELKTILTLTIVVGIITTLLLAREEESEWWLRLQFHLDLWRKYHLKQVTSPFFDSPQMPWHIRIPVIFAMGCTIYLAVDLATHLASRCFKLVRRSRRK